MSINPYNSPSSFDEPAVERRRDRATPNRPLGVTLLAGLHFFGTAVGLFGIAMLFGVLNEREAAWTMKHLGVPSMAALVGMTVILGLCFASGVGMLMGSAWGWWLATFYYLFSVARHVLTLGNIVYLVDRLDVTAAAMGEHFIKLAVRIVFHSFLVLYLYKDNVREYFGLKDVPIWKSLGWLAGATGAVILAMEILAYFL